MIVILDIATVFGEGALTEEKMELFYSTFARLHEVMWKTLPPMFNPNHPSNFLAHAPSIGSGHKSVIFLYFMYYLVFNILFEVVGILWCFIPRFWNAP